MKKILLLAFLFCSIGAFAQDIPPTDTSYHALPTYNFKYQTTTQRPWIYKGSKYGSTELATANELDGKKPYHGIETIGSLTFNNTSHVFTVAAGGLTYWNRGQKHTSTTAKTVDLDVAGLVTNKLYFIYFADTTGVLTASKTPWVWHDHTFVATVYWNGSQGAIQDEDHNHTRNIDWQIWAHSTIGTRYRAGLSLTAPTTTADATLNIASGTIQDEDHEITISAQTTMRGWYATSATVYTFADYSLPYLGTSGAPVYLDTDTYTLTTGGVAKFLCYWVYASNDQDRPIYIIPTTLSAPHNTIALARAETPPDISLIPINSEMKIIYKFIYASDGQFQEFVDYRGSSPLPAGGSSSTTAGAVSFAPYGTITNTTVQKALEEFNDSTFKNLTLNYLPKYKDKGFVKSKIWDNDKVHINGTAPDSMLTVTGGGHFTTGIKLDVATGKAPLTVASTTVNTNLNADLLDGRHVDYLARRGYVDSTFVAVLTTNGTSGAATKVGNTLNIPQYTGGSGTVTSVSALTLGTTGTDLSSTVANSTTTPVITLNVPTASATNRGALSSTDWSTFNSKQSALTNPVTGTGTTNYIPKWTGAGTLGNSPIYTDGTNVGIGTLSPLSPTGINKTLDIASGGYGTSLVLRSLATGGIPFEILSSTIGVNGYLGIYDGIASKYRIFIDKLGQVGFGTYNPISAVTVGDNTSIGAVDAQITVARSVNNNTAGNGHAFTDASEISRSGGISYNSYDAGVLFSGSNNYGHYAAFQSAPTFASSGTLSDYYGYHSSAHVNTGTITNFHGVRVDDPDGAGIVTNNYGLYVGNLTKGTNNYAAILMGKVGVGTATPASGVQSKASAYYTGLGDVILSSSFFSTAYNSESYGLAIANDAYAPIIQGMYGGGATAIYLNPLGGNVDIGFASGTVPTSDKLGVNGAIYSTNGFRTGSAGYEALFAYNYSTGNLDITPRSGYIVNVPSAATFGGLVTAPTINITTGAAVNKVWQCTNATTGAGQWATVSTSATYVGTWNASTNTPTLADGTGTAGYFYRVTVAGTQNLGSGNITFSVGDDVSYNGTVWQRLPAPTITGNALTKTDDTNVTLTLGGSPSTALLNAASLTLGWTGTLADSRIASASVWNAKESALTFGSGLSRTGNTITNTITNTNQLTNGSGYITSDMRWDGGSTGLVASTGRASLGLGGLSTINISVQTLSGTAPSWNCTNGINATLTLSGNTTVTLSNVTVGTSGNIKVTNPATTYTLTFALSGKTIKISPAVYVSSGRVLTSGASKIDMFSWYYDGTDLIINGSNDYK